MTDGIEVPCSARTRSLRTAGTIATQALHAGLVDELGVNLVPVVIGRGRPFFAEDVGKAIALDDPAEVIPARRVTHLRYSVRR